MLDAQTQRIKIAGAYLKACMTKSLRNSGMSHVQLITTLSEMVGQRGGAPMQVGA